MNISDLKKRRENSKKKLSSQRKKNVVQARDQVKKDFAKNKFRNYQSGRRAVSSKGKFVFGTALMIFLILGVYGWQQRQEKLNDDYVYDTIRLARELMNACIANGGHVLPPTKARAVEPMCSVQKGWSSSGWAPLKKGFVYGEVSDKVITIISKSGSTYQCDVDKPPCNCPRKH